MEVCDISIICNSSEMNYFLDSFEKCKFQAQKSNSFINKTFLIGVVLIALNERNRFVVLSTRYEIERFFKEETEMNVNELT